MENLGRGVVAVRNAQGKVFVSWRLLGTEPDDLAFNLYRTIGNGKQVKLNRQPISKTTNYLDESTDTTQAHSYTVKAINNGADKYDKLGPDEVKKFFAGDHTHTNKEGADVNAQSVVEGLRQNKKLALHKYLINL